MTDEKRREVRDLAREYLARGKSVEWFEALYARARGDASVVPWAEMSPNRNLLAWLDRERIVAGGRALVIGCGLGDDAEELARRGWRVTAFDISPTAIDWCRRRFTGSKVDYVVADLLNTPKDWAGAFDFVLESYTLQALPAALRAEAIVKLPGFLAPGGRLLIICRGRDESDPPGEIPWPLTRSELAPLSDAAGLAIQSFEDFLDEAQTPAVRRFRCVYQRPARRHSSAAMQPHEPRRVK
jgi:SAM-dependent methyltransferase